MKIVSVGRQPARCALRLDVENRPLEIPPRLEDFGGAVGCALAERAGMADLQNAMVPKEPKERPLKMAQRNEQGNFPEVVHAVIKDRYPKRVDMPEKPLTIGELNNMLDKLADEDGFANKKAVLHSIAVRATAREQRWST